MLVIHSVEIIHSLAHQTYQSLQNLFKVTIKALGRGVE